MPDPDFPTVRFPNPEEPGALDLALALAGTRKAVLVLANDPDADRLAVAVPGPDGAFVPLDGNEIGILLADYLLESGSGNDRLVMTTIVSSRLLSRMAADRGVQYAEALTGFKWIANRSQALHRERGTRFVFGFEEALGYTVGELVGDKDGIGAALVMADLVAHARAEGRTVFDRLEAVYRRLGMHGHRQRSLTLPGEEGSRRIQALMDGFRNAPPSSIGGLPLTVRWDLAAGTRTALADGSGSPVDLPRSNVLVFELEGGSRVLVRPSGTEPKIKFYVLTREPGDDLEAARAAATTRIKTITDEMAKLAE
jgi:phosphomannomutase